MTSVHFAISLTVLQWQVINDKSNIFHNEFRVSQVITYFNLLMTMFILTCSTICVLKHSKSCDEARSVDALYVWCQLIHHDDHSMWVYYVFWAADSRSKRFQLYMPLLPKKYFFEKLRKSADKVSKSLVLWTDCILLFVLMKKLNWSFLRWKHLFNHDTTVAWRINLWSQKRMPTFFMDGWGRLHGIVSGHLRQGRMSRNYIMSPWV